MTKPLNPTLPVVFDFDSLPIRTLDQDGEIWFVASDVAKALDYAEAKDMTRMLDEDEKGRHNVPTLGGEQEVAIINESGLYSAILRSRKPEAKRFKAWVTKDVLPTIRRTGGYAPQQLNPGELDAVLLAQELLIARPKWAALKRYAGMGLAKVEMAKLLDTTSDALNYHLKRMAACGLTDWKPNAVLSQAGAKGQAALVAKEGGAE